MDWKESIIALADGNPGAVTVMSSLMQVNPIYGQLALCRLDDLQLYGSSIWVVYKDHCKEDIHVFMKKLINCESLQEVIKKVQTSN